MLIVVQHFHDHSMHLDSITSRCSGKEPALLRVDQTRGQKFDTLFLIVAADTVALDIFLLMFDDEKVASSKTHT